MRILQFVSLTFNVLTHILLIKLMIGIFQFGIYKTNLDCFSFRVELKVWTFNDLKGYSIVWFRGFEITLRAIAIFLCSTHWMLWDSA